MQLMATKCRCHGVSGSCAVRTCWKALPPFRRVGDALKAKYRHSVEISPRAVAAAASRPPSSALLRRREKRTRREPIGDTELVYVERSPNYCRANAERGSVGTRQRQCQRGPTATGPDSCHSLCCGRGYTTTQVDRPHVVKLTIGGRAQWARRASARPLFVHCRLPFHVSASKLIFLNFIFNFCRQ